MANFMFQDLWRSLLAAALFALFALLPGYALAWLGDLFSFRRRTQPFRLCRLLLQEPLVCAHGHRQPLTAW